MTAKQLIVFCLSVRVIELHRLAMTHTGELRAGPLNDMQEIARILQGIESVAILIIERRPLF